MLLATTYTTVRHVPVLRELSWMACEPLNEPVGFLGSHRFTAKSDVAMLLAVAIAGNRFRWATTHARLFSAGEPFVTIASQTWTDLASRRSPFGLLVRKLKMRSS